MGRSAEEGISQVGGEELRERRGEVVGGEEVEEGVWGRQRGG